jgi:hypothetical protein
MLAALSFRTSSTCWRRLPIRKRDSGKVSSVILGKSYLVEDRELFTAQAVFSGKNRAPRSR